MTQTTQTNFHHLEITEEYRRLFHQYGLDTLDALFQADLGEGLSKPGLDGWRERRRLTLDDHEKSQSRVFYIKRFQHPPTRNRRAVGSFTAGGAQQQIVDRRDRCRSVKLRRWWRRHAVLQGDRRLHEHRRRTPRRRCA